MNSKLYCLIIIIFFTVISSVYPQQRMTVKPQDFKPYVTGESPNYNSSSRGYFVYQNTDVVTNIRIFPSGVNQSSVSAAIYSASPPRIFVGANTNDGVGYYYSLNGGATWTGGDLLSGSTFFSTNPSCVFGNNNRIHYNYYDNLIVSDRSNDFGFSWMGRMIVPSSVLFDMNNNTADITATSTYFGRVYAAYSDFTLSQPAIFFSYSTDGGTTYLPSAQIGQPSASHYEQGCNLQTGPNGEIYCVWSTPSMTTNIEDKIVFTKSVNGGANWSAPANALTINGIRGTILTNNIRVHSFPSMAVDRSGGALNGYIYLCWAQKNLAPAGSDADICFSYSANGGSTWSTPIRVNDDAINNGKPQFLPRISVDQSNGKIAIVYYDTRDFFNPDSCNTYMAVSTDGGNTFFNMKISSGAQRPVPLSGYADGYFTDYNSIAGLNDTFYAFWTDNRNGPAQAYTAAVNLKPYITHNPLKDSENLTGPYSVQATVNTFGTALAAGEVKIMWSRGAGADSTVMTNSSGNNWTASIPGNGSTAIYNYYIKTKDNSGRVSTLPVNAPTTTFTFKAGPDTERPSFYYNPFPSVPKNQWPDTAIVKVLDNTGIDSVWITWYRNNPSTGYYRFKLNSIGNDFYKGIFNSSPALVEPNDSIFYRIAAQDNSSNHNIDSTPLNKLYINQFYLVRIGNGTAVASYPFRTFNTDSRTEILYPASELTALGGTQARIMSIGFNVTSASPQVMSNFNLRIKNTAQTTVTGFSSTGWTNVYPLNYTVAGTGWQYLIFQNPFIWDGTSNLLLEICFDDNGFNSNSSVLATPMSNMVWHQSADLTGGSGCTDLTGGTMQINRPNITFIMNSILNVREIENTIPKDFSLSQNYPNPFNPTTNIRYQIANNSFVTLKIYDLLGREIETLVSEKQNAGTYITQFNGEQLSSGVYFYKLTAGDFSDVKRMLFIK
jgi:hypothetical protein